MPSRTRVDSPFSAKKVFSASARAGTSATSPSRRMPGRRGATAPRLRDTEPLAVTSAAAMWPGSRSRPTIAAWEEERFLNTFVISARAPGYLTTKRAPEGPLRGKSIFRLCRLPLAAGRATLLAVRIALTGDAAARGLDDAELAAGLGLRDLDGVRVDRLAGDLQAVESDTLLEGGLDLGERASGTIGGADVGLLVGVVGLESRLGRTGGRLGLGVLSLGALVEERGQGDRGEDADDQDDDQELDQGETLLALGALAELMKHCGWSLLRDRWACGL